MDPTQRFSTRVENYVKYRPSYPGNVVALLAAECGLTPNSVIADLGSGTGLLAQLFLANGNRVHGIEPNAEMREAGARELARFPGFESHDGTAEATTLPDGSIDIVTAAQAFHWFKIEPARSECRRILRPGGWVALVWNSRQLDSTAFLRDYDALLRNWSDDYRAVNHQDNIGNDALAAFFPGGHRRAAFPNQQVFDYEGLKGRLLSSSYAPDIGHPNHDPMLRNSKAFATRIRHRPWLPQPGRSATKWRCNSQF